MHPRFGIFCLQAGGTGGDLRKAPKVTVAQKGAVSSIYYESEPYKGKPTRVFADPHLKKGVMLANVGKLSRKGNDVEVHYDAKVKVTSAALHYTTDEGPWQKREWKTVALKVGDGPVNAERPKGRPLVYFITLTDELEATVSTEHEVVEK